MYVYLLPNSSFAYSVAPTKILLTPIYCPQLFVQNLNGTLDCVQSQSLHHKECSVPIISRTVSDEVICYSNKATAPLFSTHVLKFFSQPMQVFSEAIIIISLVRSNAKRRPLPFSSKRSCSALLWSQGIKKHWTLQCGAKLLFRQLSVVLWITNVWN